MTNTAIIDYYPNDNYVIVSAKKFFFFKKKIFDQHPVDEHFLLFIKNWYEDLNWVVKIKRHEFF